MDWKRLREERDLTGVKAAAGLGVHPQTLHNWERGRQVPSFKRKQQMLDYYGVTGLTLEEKLNLSKPEEKICVGQVREMMAEYIAQKAEQT